MLSVSSIPWLWVISVASNLLALVLPLALLQVYDRILPSAEYGTAISLFVGVAIAMVMDGILRMTRSRAIARAAALRDHRQSVDLAGQLLHADTARLRAVGTGTRRGAFDAIGEAGALDAAAARLPFHDLPFAAIFLVLVWFVGGSLALIPLAILLLCSALALGVSLRQRDAAIQRAQARHATISVLADLLAGLTDLKGFGLAGRLLNHADRAMRDVATRTETVERRDSLLTDWMQAASLAATVGITLAGAALVLAGGMTTGGLAACTILGGRAVTAGLGVFGAMARRGTAQAAQAQVEALRASLDRPTAPTIASGRDIVLRGVAARRADATVGPVDAVIGANAITVLEAPHLADAMLLARIAAGLEAPDAGVVSLAGSAVIVPPRPVLFGGTVLDNLTGWDAGRADAARDMAAALGLPALVDRLPGGMQTPLGASLLPSFSAGIVKRIALARALAGPAGLIVLVNPETDLDIDGRQRLARVLAAQSRTILLVTADASLAALASNTIREAVAA